MITWVLIFVMYGPTDVATVVPGFGSKQECEQAYAAIKSAMSGVLGSPQIPHACVQQTRTKCGEVEKP